MFRGTVESMGTALRRICFLCLPSSLFIFYFILFISLIFHQIQFLPQITAYSLPTLSQYFDRPSPLLSPFPFPFPFPFSVSKIRRIRILNKNTFFLYLLLSSPNNPPSSLILNNK
ncbi:hypothetical protein RIF29_39597 [Crotalaria pallida]|uniref:Uncharacterized protein n=1 Tax=Crotalaria pallida TaxID=3830 RepID=A0AAN9HPX5_CROPI